MDVNRPLFLKWAFMFLIRKHMWKDFEEQEVHDALRQLI
jgi:hypothetical protein